MSPTVTQCKNHSKVGDFAGQSITNDRSKLILRPNSFRLWHACQSKLHLTEPNDMNDALRVAIPKGRPSVRWFGACSVSIDHQCPNHTSAASSI